MPLGQGGGKVSRQARLRAVQRLEQAGGQHRGIWRGLARQGAEGAAGQQGLDGTSQRKKQ